MRIPKDPDNWTMHLAERLIARAWKLFEKYEAHVDFDKPQEVNDRWYLPYYIAREDAVRVTAVTYHWLNIDKVEMMLP